MLARFLLSTFLLTTIIFGKSTQFSPIPAASNEVLTIDPQECDEECQKKLLEDGKVFTFISKHNDDSSNTYLRGKYQVLQSIFKIEDNEENTEGVKIALLAPTSVIGRYSSMVTDAVSSFLIYKKQDYTLKVYDSKTEDYDALYETIEKIKEDGFTYVIAPLTPKGVETLTEIDLDDNFIYVPTVNKDEILKKSDRIIFGGIDYKEQLKVLSGYEQGNKILIFEEPIGLSKKLTSYSDETIMLPPTVIEIKTKRAKFKEIFEEEVLDKNTTILLNTRPVMTSLILSQLTYHDVNVSAVLTTQMNYSPMILTLTQNDDLKDLYVANAITKDYEKLYEINKLTDNNLMFNWIVYSTSILTDLIVQDYNEEETHISKTFSIEVQNGNLIYPTNVYKVERKRFVIAPEPVFEEETTEDIPTEEHSVLENK